VRTWAPVNYYWKHRSYTVKGAYGAVDQKPDDITPLGITRPVRLIASEDIAFKELAVDTRLTDDGNAEIAVEVELDGNPVRRQQWSSRSRRETLLPRHASACARPSLAASCDW